MQSYTCTLFWRRIKHTALTSALLSVYACGLPTPAYFFSPPPLAGPAYYPTGISSVTGFSATSADVGTTSLAREIRRKVAADGFTWLRFDINWEQLEPTKGQYSWLPLDRQVAGIVATGLRPLAVLAYGHRDYMAHPEECRSMQKGTTHCPPDDLDDFADYARAVAEHFRGRIQIYELWNEANNWFRFWSNHWGGDPARYADMMVRAARAIHEVCPACTVLSGGLVYLDFSPVVTGQETFLPAMLAAQPDLFQVLDGVGVHHYGLYPPVNSPESNGAGEVPLDEVLYRTRQQCACDNPMWITETGWTVSGGISRHNQARYGVRSLLIALTHGINSWLWWSIAQMDPQGLIAAQEANFGVLDPFGKENLVYQALARVNQLIGTAETVQDVRRRFRLSSPDQWAVRLTFPDNARCTRRPPQLVVWADTEKSWAAPPEILGKAGTNLITGASIVLQNLSGDPVLLLDPQPANP